MDGVAIGRSPPPVEAEEKQPTWVCAPQLPVKTCKAQAVLNVPIENVVTVDVAVNLPHPSSALPALLQPDQGGVVVAALLIVTTPDSAVPTVTAVGEAHVPKVTA